jgi:hypothetical protein
VIWHETKIANINEHHQTRHLPLPGFKRKVKNGNETIPSISSRKIIIFKGSYFSDLFPL